MERRAMCKNVGVCSRANKEQIITDDDAEFVCPECGEPLQPVKPDVNNGKGGGKGNKKPLMIAGGVVLAACICGGVYLGMGSGKTDATALPTDTTKVDSTKQEQPVNEPKAKEPQKVKEGGGTTTTTTTPPNKKGPKKYPFASFDGTTMVFKTSHTIPGTSEVAEPGDKVTGVWDDNGEVNSVRWYHADGTASEVLTHE